MTKFEEYLHKQFMGEEPTVLDDDLSDAYEVWLENLQADDFIKFADEFAEELLKDIERGNK